MGPGGAPANPTGSTSDTLLPDLPEDDAEFTPDLSDNDTESHPDGNGSKKRKARDGKGDGPAAKKLKRKARQFETVLGRGNPTMQEVWEWVAEWRVNERVCIGPVLAKKLFHFQRRVWRTVDRILEKVACGHSDTQHGLCELCKVDYNDYWKQIAKGLQKPNSRYKHMGLQYNPGEALFEFVGGLDIDLDSSEPEDESDEEDEEGGDRGNSGKEDESGEEGGDRGNSGRGDESDGEVGDG